MLRQYLMQSILQWRLSHRKSCLKSSLLTTKKESVHAVNRQAACYIKRVISIGIILMLSKTTGHQGRKHKPLASKINWAAHKHYSKRRHKNLDSCNILVWWNTTEKRTRHRKPKNFQNCKFRIFQAPLNQPIQSQIIVDEIKTTNWDRYPISLVN